jgi:signal transduction histidine kinase
MHDQSPSARSFREVRERPELRAVLAHLQEELSKPLIDLRSQFQTILAGTECGVVPAPDAHVATLAQVCDDLFHITQTYFDFAGLLQGSRPLTASTVALSSLAADLDERFAPRFAEHNVSWDCGLRSPDGVVITDDFRCREIFDHLVKNALQSTREGGSVSVAFQLERETWTVSVTDDGAGIPEDERSLVFEPFYRLRRDQASGIDRSGLGLSICQCLTQQLLGTIAIESSEATGTSVVVRLPVAMAERPLTGS